jgi:2-methylfumaryl-CoA isomerase
LTENTDGNRLYGAYGDAFATADGRYIMVVAISDRQWRVLLEALELEASLAEAARSSGHRLDTEGARYEARNVISEHFRPWFRKRTLVEVEQILGKHPVLWGVYRTSSQMLAEDPRCSERNPMFRRLEHPGVGTFLTAASPLSFGGCERALPSLAPALGADTAAVLSEWLDLSGGRGRAIDGHGCRRPQAHMTNPHVELLVSCQQAQDACESLLEGLLSSFRRSGAAVRQ